MFEPKDNGDSIELKVLVIILILLLGMTLFAFAQLGKTIQEIPKETIKLIHTEINP